MSATRAEIIISRLIDGEAGAADWQEFTTLAGAAPELWRELAEAQRQQELLVAAVANVTKGADAVELPDLAEDNDAYVHVNHTTLRTRVSAWAGWGIAAALAIALWTGFTPTANTGAGNPNAHQANIGSSIANMASSDLLKAYLDKGKDEGNVLGELPDKVLVETRPNPVGKGYEVLYIRTILERTSVPTLYQFNSQDETGRPVAAKYTGGARRPL